ncbi:unnamed protein product, partial [Didymodactylos carnosus]
MAENQKLRKEHLPVYDGALTQFPVMAENQKIRKEHLPVYDGALTHFR